MTPLQIKQAASEIAARIPAMAQDCATNNAVVIEGMLTEACDRALGARVNEQHRQMRHHLAKLKHLPSFGGDSCKISLPNRIP